MPRLKEVPRRIRLSQANSAESVLQNSQDSGAQVTVTISQGNKTETYRTTVDAS